MREAGEPSTWVGEVAEPYVNAGRSQGQKRKAVRREEAKARPRGIIEAGTPRTLPYQEPFLEVGPNR